MKLIARNFKLKLDQEEGDLKKIAASHLGIMEQSIKGLEIVRKSLDARREDIKVVYTLELELDDHADLPPRLFEIPGIVPSQSISPLEIKPGSRPLAKSPVVVGMGPAGLFCALTLARAGYRPVLLERGQDVDRRVESVQKFWTDGSLDSESNVQFGEGGAGTFSDGKLTTRIGDQRVEYVLETMVNFGAAPEVKYLKKPHVGTDHLRQIVKSIRKEILALGGSVYFSARVTDLAIENGILRGLVVNDSTTIESSVVVLAVGNSARDVYRTLHRHGVTLIPKGFAVGARVEHPQELIDKVQFGQYAGHPKLGQADYHMTYQDQTTGRALYTFCMCPGGQVIASSSGQGQVVTNGMSYFARNSGRANSALVVSVGGPNLDSHPLAGVEFQEQLESRAFKAGGGDYQAPVQTVQDFLENKKSTQVESTYRPGSTPANLWGVLPNEICGVMARGLKSFDRKIPGFAGPEAVLIGVETRTSAPLRIERNSEFNSVNLKGLYPCGEGAGYAGGIVSSAVDGIKIAEKIIECFGQPHQSSVGNIDGAVDAKSGLEKITLP